MDTDTILMAGSSSQLTCVGQQGVLLQQLQ